MNLNLAFDETDLKEIIVREFNKRLNLELTESDIIFEVKTAHNYKAEWENGRFRAVVNKPGMKISD